MDYQNQKDCWETTDWCWGGDYKDIDNHETYTIGIFKAFEAKLRMKVPSVSIDNNFEIKKNL